MRVFSLLLALAVFPSGCLLAFELQDTTESAALSGSVTLGSNIALERIAYPGPTPAPLPTGVGNTNPSTAGVGITGSGATASGTGAGATAGPAPTSAGDPPVELLPTPVSAWTTFTGSLTAIASAGTPSLSSLNCVLTGWLSGRSCTGGSVNVSEADFTEEAVAQMKFSNSSGSTLLSTTLPVEYTTVRVVVDLDTGGNDIDSNNDIFPKTLDGWVYFAKYDRLYRTKDGTTECVNADNFGDQVRFMEVMGSWLYFTAAHPISGGTKVYRTNGTVIEQVSNLRANQARDDVNVNGTPGAVFGGHVYFLGYRGATATGYLKMFKTDGSTVTQVSNIANNNSANDTNLTGLTPWNNALYFIAGQLMRTTDGVSIERVTNFTASYCPKNSGYANRNEMHTTSTHLYFNGSPSGSSKLFRLSTAGVIEQVSNTNPSGNDNPCVFGHTSDGIYFSSMNAAGYYKLYLYNGTGVIQVSDLNAGDDDFRWYDRESYFVAHDDRLYLHMRNTSTVSGDTVYRTNGAKLELLLKDHYDYMPLGVYNGRVYICADGRYYRTSGGEDPKLSLISDPALTPCGSGMFNQGSFGVVVGNILYFSYQTPGALGKRLSRLCDASAGCTP